jgi:hypothetical protein
MRQCLKNIDLAELTGFIIEGGDEIVAKMEEYRVTLVDKDYASEIGQFIATVKEHPAFSKQHKTIYVGYGEHGGNEGFFSMNRDYYY